MLAVVLAGAVQVSVLPPDNLADATSPIPTLVITNDTKEPIELQVFEGVPYTIPEHPDASGKFPDKTPLMVGCGNGYGPHQIAPGETEVLPLWVRLDNGPGTSGNYRVIVPYEIVRGKARVDREVASNAFDLHYGDIAPPEPVTKPGALVLLTAEREHNSPRSQLSPAALGRKLLPAVEACIAPAQKRLPWLRGRFTLVVTQYNDPKPTLSLSSSVLGDAATNACLAKLTVTDNIPMKYELTFAITPPL